MHTSDIASPWLFRAILCLALTLAMPAWSAERWTAASRTASAITGDITIDEERLTFGNGASIAIRPAGANRPGVYRLDPPASPALLNGNRLCGKRPIRFLVIARDGNELYLKAFNGTKAPVAAVNPLPQPGTCATFNYQGVETVGGRKP